MTSTYCVSSSKLRSENSEAKENALTTYESLVKDKYHNDLYQTYEAEMYRDIERLISHYMAINDRKAGVPSMVVDALFHDFAFSYGIM